MSEHDRLSVAIEAALESGIGYGWCLPRTSGAPEIFFPDVTGQAKANVGEVGEGAELSNIDITLRPAVENRSYLTFKTAYVRCRTPGSPTFVIL